MHETANYNNILVKYHAMSVLGLREFGTIHLVTHKIY